MDVYNLEHNEVGTNPQEQKGNAVQGKEDNLCFHDVMTPGAIKVFQTQGSDRTSMNTAFLLPVTFCILLLISVIYGFPSA